MHVLADTWAHRYFAGTPSLVINNTNRFFVELVPNGDGSFTERQVKFGHNPAIPDDFDNSLYTNTMFQPSENTIMNLGHGRAGHLPDYSFMRYRYMPAWNDYEEVLKDNPTEYYQAFCQMVYAMKCLRGERGPFRLNTYATDEVAPYEQEIRQILEKRQPAEDAIEDWRAFGERLCGQAVPLRPRRARAGVFGCRRQPQGRHLPGQVHLGGAGPKGHGSKPRVVVGQSACRALDQLQRQGLCRHKGLPAPRPISAKR